MKKKLLRSYTQNIDGLEARVGLLGTSCQAAKSSSKGKSKIRTKEVRNVELHGNIHRVRCMACSAEYPCTEDHLNAFNVGAPPDCPECLSRCTLLLGSSSHTSRDDLCVQLKLVWRGLLAQSALALSDQPLFYMMSLTLSGMILVQSSQPMCRASQTCLLSWAHHSKFMVSKNLSRISHGRFTPPIHRGHHLSGPSKSSSLIKHHLRWNGPM